MASFVVTDSTAYLPADILQRYGVKVVPLNVSLAGEVFKEGLVYSNAQYYQRLRTEKIFPSTSQPATGDFYQAFSQAAPGDTVICITISGELSGTVHSAQVAREMLPEHNIVIVDSRSTVMGLGFQVIRACEMLAAGVGAESIVAELQYIREHVSLFFIVDDLEYLVRGGRLTRVGQFLGNILQIKPILQVESGVIKVYDKVRTKHKALERILEDFAARNAGQAVQEVCVLHVDAREEALRLKERVAGFFAGPVMMSEAGPVIGSHVGPGALGLCYY